VDCQGSCAAWATQFGPARKRFGSRGCRLESGKPIKAIRARSKPESLSYAECRDGIQQYAHAGISEGGGRVVDLTILPGQRRNTLAVTAASHVNSGNDVRWQIAKN
jgi:hypothetical protein